MSLDDDLARWEAGSLSRDDLFAAHTSDKNLAEPWDKNLAKNLQPNIDKNAIERNLAGVLDLHERLTELGTAPVPYYESEWDELREKLPDRLPQRRVFGGGRLARPLIAAAMVVGLTAGAAAASPTVRHHMISVWHDVQYLVGIDNDGSADTPNGITTTPSRDGSRDQVGTGATGSPRPQPTPSSEDPTGPADQPTEDEEPVPEEPQSPGGGGGGGGNGGGGGGGTGGGMPEPSPTQLF